MDNQIKPALGIRDVALILMCTSLFSMLPLGYSIRTFFDSAEYGYVLITLGISGYLIIMSREFYRIAFRIDNIKGVLVT